MRGSIGTRNRKILSDALRPIVLLGVVLVPPIGLGTGVEQLTYAQDPTVHAGPGVMRPRPLVTDIKRDKLIFTPTPMMRSLTPPPDPPPADSQTSVFEIIGKPLPLSIPKEYNGLTILVVADTLELQTGAYTFGSAKHVIIVADTVRLNGIATFDLAAGRPQAGNLTIITRKYVTGEKGYLSFLNKGSDPNTSAGQLLLVADTRELRSKLSKQGEGIFLPPYAVEVQTGQIDGAFKIGKVFSVLGNLWIDKSINPQIPNGSYIVGYWASTFLSKIAKDIQLTVPLTDGAKPSSLTPEQQEELIRLVKKGKSLSPIFKDLQRSPFTDIAIASKKWVDLASAILTLWTDEIRLPGNNSAQVVYDGTNQTIYLAPTGSLVRVVVNDDRRYLGYLDQNPQNPTQALVSFDVKLSVDTDTEQEVNKVLSKQLEGFSYKGQFRGYEVEASDFGTELPEVKSANVTSSGDDIHVLLRLDHESTGLALARLASGSGIPLHLKWTYANVHGVWRIPISLARRDLIDVEVFAQGIRNSGKLAVTVEYVLLSDRSIIPFDPAITLQPGESKTIVIPQETDLSKVRIPPDAVSYHVAANPDREFLWRDPSIYDTVEITNLLGAHHELGQLQYVELTVIYSYHPSEGIAPAKNGPFRLSAKDTYASQKTISFRKRGKGDRDIMITGVAVFESGSQQTLKAKTFQSLAAAIEWDMLPAQ